jgi:O-succinylbenzoic acid--CoA ligase
VQGLLAIDLPLGLALEESLRRCADDQQAFCILDQRLSLRRRAEELALLGATAVLDGSGQRSVIGGRDLDDDVGLVMLTSGSSGTPKAAELTWSALRASARLTQASLRADGPPVWFPCLPANHIGGLAVLLRAILGDASLLWTDDGDLERAATLGATHVSIVRTQLARFNVSGFYRVLLGGARPPRDRPPNVVATWGMTETGSGVVYDGYPLEGVELVAIDGELCVRTPTLFRSYRHAPRPTILGPDGRDDWFPTGDAGDVVDGRVHVRGRLGYVINTGGEKLWPEDLEVLVASIQGITDVAVTGVDDPEWGQRVVALVVADGNNYDDEIRAVATERLGPWAKPKDIRYVVAIPRTGNGKIRRSELANLR